MCTILLTIITITFWVLILSIVCLCQGFQLCIVCKIGKTLLRKGKQVLIMKTCCGFNIYHNVHTSLRCKLYHVTINYENIILQHLNIYSVNVDNVFGDHMKVCFAIVIISRKKTILEEQRISIFFSQNAQIKHDKLALIFTF